LHPGSFVPPRSKRAEFALFTSSGRHRPVEITDRRDAGLRVGPPSDIEIGNAHRSHSRAGRARWRRGGIRLHIQRTPLRLQRKRRIGGCSRYAYLWQKPSPLEPMFTRGQMAIPRPRYGRVPTRLSSGMSPEYRDAMIKILAVAPMGTRCAGSLVARRQPPHEWRSCLGRCSSRSWSDARQATPLRRRRVGGARLRPDPATAWCTAATSVSSRSPAVRDEKWPSPALGSHTVIQDSARRAASAGVARRPIHPDQSRHKAARQGDDS
jgi:hypothetical protein